MQNYRLVPLPSRIRWYTLRSVRSVHLFLGLPIDFFLLSLYRRASAAVIYRQNIFSRLLIQLFDLEFIDVVFDFLWVVSFPIWSCRVQPFTCLKDLISDAWILLKSYCVGIVYLVTDIVCNVITQIGAGN